MLKSQYSIYLNFYVFKFFCIYFSLYFYLFLFIFIQNSSVFVIVFHRLSGERKTQTNIQANLKQQLPCKHQGAIIFQSLESQSANTRVQIAKKPTQHHIEQRNNQQSHTITADITREKPHQPKA